MHASRIGTPIPKWALPLDPSSLASKARERRGLHGLDGTPGPLLAACRKPRTAAENARPRAWCAGDLSRPQRAASRADSGTRAFTAAARGRGTTASPRVLTFVRVPFWNCTARTASLFALGGSRTLPRARQASVAGLGREPRQGTGALRPVPTPPRQGKLLSSLIH